MNKIVTTIVMVIFTLLIFTADIVLITRFLVSFIITNLFLAISQLTRKIKNFQQNTISAKVYYIELIIIPIIIIFSLYFFDSVFKVFTKYYFELSME